MNGQQCYSIGETALKLGVSVVTIRRWDKLGKLPSQFRTIGNHRRFTAKTIARIHQDKARINVCYARVSSYDQKKDLETQASYLSHYCREQQIEHIVIKDLGSGLNFKKKGLNKLIGMILSGEIDTIYVSNKDRLLRFGSELVVKIAAQFNTNIVFLEDKAQNFEQTLAKDVLEIITVFSAKLYGSRSHKKTRKKMTSHNTS
jgi:putative resolvase